MYGVYGNFEVHSSFLVRRRIDCLNAHKSPYPLAADMDIVGGFHIVKPLILCKLRADAVGRHGLLRVIVAPSCIGFIDRLGAGFAVCPKADIALGLQELDHIVAAALDRLHILSGFARNAELIIVPDQPVQSLQTPEKDTLLFPQQLVHQKRIVRSACRSVFGGQHDLAAEETVGFVVQGGQRTVSEAEEAHIKLALISSSDEMSVSTEGIVSTDLSVFSIMEVSWSLLPRNGSFPQAVRESCIITAIATAIMAFPRIADACRIVSILAVIAVKNTGLVLVLLLVLPLFAVFTRHVQKRMLSAQLDNRRAVAAVSGLVPEMLHNIRTIRVLGMEAYMERRYDRRIADGYAAMERTNFYDAIYSPVVLLLNAVVVGIVMLLSASGNAEILHLFGMSVGTSVAVISYISRIFAPIESLGMEIQAIQSAMAGVRRIDAFLAQPERAVPKRNETAARGDVALSHVTFGYGEKPVLRDFSMTVRQGEQVTLVGRTGAGKSTVFKLLLGLYRPESGTVTIGGVDVSRISDQERRTCIGCVEQHFSRVPGSVLDQITLGDPQITAAMAKNAAQLAGIDAAVQALPEGYDTVCTEGMFSQGEWQLLSIARAAAADPAVLLLDEITANLDAETEARVLEALRRASEGRTVLSVSHRIYENLGGRTIEVRAQV